MSFDFQFLRIEKEQNTSCARMRLLQEQLRSLEGAGGRHADQVYGRSRLAVG